MKHFKFGTKKVKNRMHVFATVKVTLMGLTVLTQNFSCLRKPKLGVRCWVAEKKHSAYVLNKKLCDELTREYYK